MYIEAVSKALTENRYGQKELTDLLKDVWKSQASSRTISRLEKFHDSVQVKTRHLALPKKEYEQLDSFTKANQAFIRVGSDLAAKALSGALEQSELEANDIDAIFFTTVTGLAVPTIDARLMNKMQLRRDVKRTPLFGLGCVAGVAGIARMHDYLKAYPDQTAALVSVELCSLTLQSADLSVANAIASGLFGDGASAVIATGVDKKTVQRTGRPKILRSKSCFYHDSEDVMGWDIGSDGFKIILSAKVPQFVQEYLPSDLDNFLTESGLQRSDISTWVCHPGGPKVLEAMESALGVSRHELELTWQSLQEVGNLSSSSVLFVLADTMKYRRGKPGEYGVMIAMGPGFCSELVLFQW